MKKIVLLFFIVVCSSCITKRKINYLQSDNYVSYNNISNDLKKNEFRSPTSHKIKPNDELIINVSSFDDLSFNYFNAESQQRTMQASNEMSINAMSYTVNVDGYVHFPVVGDILVEGLTLSEAREKLRGVLTPYFNQPNVTIKFAYKTITVIGEVNSPGYYTYTKDQITIFDALAMARDLTIHGNRRKVTLIRNDGNVANKFKIDLTDDSQVFNYNYYLEPGDVIYVSPRGSAKWTVISTPLTLLFSTITTILLVYNAID